MKKLLVTLLLFSMSAPVCSMSAYAQTPSAAIAEYSADQGQAVTTVWDNYSGGSTTYRHDTKNTAGKQVVAGIDVSYHQGTIDWAKVKASGVDYALIRVGYRGYTSGTIGGDRMFEEYLAGAKAAGLKVGVYFYSQAINVKEAEEEADYVLSKLNSRSLDMPVAFDYEYYGAEEGRVHDAGLSKREKTDCAKAFCDKIRSAGYKTMVYANAGWFEKELYADELAKNNQLWMARYNTYSYDSTKDANRYYGGQIDMWQCSSHAKVDGIDDRVDLNFWYEDTHPYGWVVYDQESEEWYYEKNGRVQEDYTGVAENENGWWYIKDGKVDFTANTVAENMNGWWKITDGKVDFGFNGFASNENGWWYLENGKVNFDKNDVMIGTVNGEYAWWHVVNSNVVFDETVANNANGWWYIKNGKVDFSANTMAENMNGWWKIVNGKVDFSFNGFEQNQYGWWYLEGGHVNFDKNDVMIGTVNGEYAWWNVRDSKVQNYVTVANNLNGWWYIDSEGKVDFSFNGLASNENGQWILRNGMVDFGYSGVYVEQGMCYTIANGRVIGATPADSNVSNINTTP